MIQTYTITTPEYGKVVDWLEEILTGMKVTRREIFVAELLLEENFYRLAEASGDASSFSARLDVRKRFGDVDLRLSAHGEPFNPLEEMNEATEDTAELYSLAILKAHRDKISHSWKKGENVISMRIHRSDSKTAVHTLIALVLGVVLGVAMKAGLGAETIRWVGDNLFLPVETIFMNALLMVAAPLIFFSVTAGITGMSDAADIGRMGGSSS